MMSQTLLADCARRLVIGDDQEFSSAAWAAISPLRRVRPAGRRAASRGSWSPRRTRAMLDPTEHAHLRSILVGSSRRLRTTSSPARYPAVLLLLATLLLDLPRHYWRAVDDQFSIATRDRRRWPRRESPGVSRLGSAHGVHLLVERRSDVDRRVLRVVRARRASPRSGGSGTLMTAA